MLARAERHPLMPVFIVTTIAGVLILFSFFGNNGNKKRNHELIIFSYFECICVNRENFYRYTYTKQTINMSCCQILDVEVFTRLCTKDFQKNKGTAFGKNRMHFISGCFTNTIGKFLFVKKLRQSYR